MIVSYDPRGEAWLTTAVGDAFQEEEPTPCVPQLTAIIMPFLSLEITVLGASVLASQDLVETAVNERPGVLARTVGLQQRVQSA